LEAIAKSHTIKAYLHFCPDEEDSFESTWDQPKLQQLYKVMATTQGAQIASWAFLRTLPGPVKQLCIHGEQALKPQNVNGNWMGA